MVRRALDCTVERLVVCLMRWLSGAFEVIRIDDANAYGSSVGEEHGVTVNRTDNTPLLIRAKVGGNVC